MVSPRKSNCPGGTINRPSKSCEDWPKPGHYLAEGYAGQAPAPGEENAEPACTWKFVYTDDKGSTGRIGERNDPNAIRAQQRAHEDTYARLEFDVTNARRARDAAEAREEVARGKLRAHVEALNVKDAENLALTRERDLAFIERDRALLQFEAARDERDALIEAGGEFAEPIERGAAAAVAAAFELLGVPPEENTIYVRAAVEDIGVTVAQNPATWGPIRDAWREQEAAGAREPRKHDPIRLLRAHGGLPPDGDEPEEGLDDAGAEPPEPEGPPGMSGGGTPIELPEAAGDGQNEEEEPST